MLKTLKDFNKKYNFEFGYFGNLMKIFNLDEDCASETNHVLCHFVGDLKQEAIKRYKILSKIKSDLYVLGKKHMLEEFFDITEEDLK